MLTRQLLGAVSSSALSLFAQALIGDHEFHTQRLRAGGASGSTQAFA